MTAYHALLRSRRRYIVPVPDSARIQLSTSTIMRTWIEGTENPVAESLGITNVGQGAFAGVQVSDDAAWIDVTGTDPALVSFNMTGKTVSDHPLTGTVTVSDANADNSPQTASVTISIQASGGSPAAVIDAEVRTFNTTGAGLVSAGFPLRPGDLTDQQVSDREVAVWIGGSEKQVYVEALRGRFPDGSVRSVLLQFTHNIPDSSPIQAEVRIGTARGTSDLSKTTVTDSVIRAGRVLLATDPAYLSNTWVTFQPILPASSENGTNAAYFNTFFHNREAVGRNFGLTSGAYQSTYESGVSIISRWQAEASPSLYWHGIERSLNTLVNYSLPAQGAGAFNPEPNTTGMTTAAQQTSGPVPPEWHSQRYLTFGAAYLLTGAIEFWNVICINWSWISFWVDSQAEAQAYPSTTFGIRFNLRGLWSLVILSVALDATKPWQSNAGFWTGQQIDFPTEIPWYLDSFETHKFVNGYRANLRGLRETMQDSFGVGEFPHFQIPLFNSLIIRYLLNIKWDATLAGWVKTNTDIVWDNDIVALQPGDFQYAAGSRFGYRYLCVATAGGSGELSPWTMPMWADSLAFCHAVYGDQKYADNYVIAINPANMAPDGGGGGNLSWGNFTGNPGLFWKLFGEAFGHGMCAPYFMQTGLPGNLPSTIRTPTQY